MKNGKLVTEYLDACEEKLTLLRGRTLESAQQYLEVAQSGRTEALWNACLADGWTMAELDAAYGRRFGVTVDRETGRMVKVSR